LFTDPQSVTISGSAKSLARISTGDNAARYANDDGSVLESVQHSYGKRNRRTFRIAVSKYAADPLFPSQNVPYSMSFYIVADVPKVGYTVAEQKAVIDGFITQLNATSGALITKWLSGEN
jgi:hypothetical protein